IKDEYTNGCQSYTRVGLFIQYKLAQASLSSLSADNPWADIQTRTELFMLMKLYHSRRYEVVWSDGEGYTQRGVKGI
ncbi:hypothetical protein BDFB_010905, partial [Asbolus verrucosus]